MLQFVCDYCANVKQSGETWITGLAVENVGTQAARREAVIDAVWRYERAVLPLAVHFCCLACKDGYLARLFNRPATLLEVTDTEVQPATGRRVIHARKKPVSESIRKSTSRKKQAR